MTTSIDTYMKDLTKRGKLLTAQEEVELSKLIEAGDTEARRKMIESNMRLAVSVAKSYAKYGCDLIDLIQEANFGLIKAVDKFDWRRGFRFSTYAVWWIRQSVLRSISAQISTIKIPGYVRKLMREIKRVRTEKIDETGSSPSAEELSQILKVDIHKIEETLMIFGEVYSLDELIFHHENEPKARGEFIEMSEAMMDNMSVEDGAISKIDRDKMRSTVVSALKTLTPREEKIFRLRYGITDIALEDLDSYAA